MNLPDAFEKALEGIMDKSYQGRILKLVMAAESPLAIADLRAALALEIGDAQKWCPNRVPRDGAQLITLCGGDLLEVDEEDGRVRFIHHSVINHILPPATRPSTNFYHFSLENAHNFAGSVCVTYLNLPPFESRMMLSRKIQVENLVERVTKPDDSVISLLMQHMKSRKRASAPYNFDITQLVALGGQTSLQTDDFDPRCFKDYASKNWLFHTRHFRQDDIQSESCWPLWWRLVSGQVQQMTLPFQSLKQIPSQEDYCFSEALTWVQANGHTGVLITVFSECTYTRRDKLCYLIHQYRSRRDSIFDEWLECTINALFQELGSKKSPVFLKQRKSRRGRI